jgi:single-strand DNA-binding protein
MNKVCLIGRLGKDIEIRYAQNESKTAVGRFSLAVKRPHKKDETDWINCVAFGKTAETLSKYFKKGSGIAVSGRIQTGNYKNKDGKTVYTFDVVVEEFYFIDKKSDTPQSDTPQSDTGYTVDTTDDEDLPF